MGVVGVLSSPTHPWGCPADYNAYLYTFLLTHTHGGRQSDTKARGCRLARTVFVSLSLPCRFPADYNSYLYTFLPNSMWGVCVDM